MDDAKFDALIRTFHSRRTALAGVLGSVAALLALTSAEEISAHNPAPACKKLSDPVKRRRCLRRARAHKRNRHSCKPKPPAQACGGRCGGTAVNNCRKRVACPGCPAGKTCLGNGSCARSCPVAQGPGCPGDCFCDPGVDGGNHCFADPSLECEDIPQVCVSSAQCLLGFGCSIVPCGLGGSNEGRCVPLCLL